MTPDFIERQELVKDFIVSIFFKCVVRLYPSVSVSLSCLTDTVKGFLTKILKFEVQ